jgi:hypothetical protein
MFSFAECLEIRCFASLHRFRASGAAPGGKGFKSRSIPSSSTEI